MTSDEAGQFLEELDSPESISYVRRLRLTYRVLAGLRAIIDESDSALNRLAHTRDSNLYLLGESALTDLNSQNPTLDQTAFARNLEGLRDRLDALTSKAEEAHEKHASTAVTLAEVTQRLDADRDLIEDKIEKLERVLFEMPDDEAERDAHLEELAEKMVVLKRQRDEIAERQREHSDATEAALHDLSATARTRQDAVNQTDSRVKAVVRDLGRSVLTIDHPLRLSDPARSVEETLEEMTSVRADRNRAVSQLDRVDTTPIVHFLVISLITASALLTGIFWLT